MIIGGRGRNTIKMLRLLERIEKKQTAGDGLSLLMVAQQPAIAFSDQDSPKPNRRAHYQNHTQTSTESSSVRTQRRRWCDSTIMSFKALICLEVTSSKCLAKCIAKIRAISPDTRTTPKMA